MMAKADALLFQSTLPNGERLHGHTGRTKRHVSIHAPERGATSSAASTITNFPGFNPRSRTGERQLTGGHGLANLGFNPRSRTGSGRLRLAMVLGYWMVSIHAPERGATTHHTPRYKNIIVSIHAPERGATIRLYYGETQISVSIHAPERGATNQIAVSWPREKFQSTLPNGERLNAKRGFPWEANPWVSIHAPERGATSWPHWSYQTACFNPRSRTGSDLQRSEYDYQLSRFQSTLPNGERPYQAIRHGADIRFQSTLPNGERLPDVSDLSTANLFQSTLPNGERRRC